MGTIRKILLVSPVLFIFVVSIGYAQTPNIGYYEKIHDDGETATYQLIWSAYSEVAELEPELPEDFVIYPPDPGGGDCGADFCDPHGAGGGSTREEEPWRGPPMQVTRRVGGRAQNFFFIAYSICRGSRCGGDGGAIGRGRMQYTTEDTRASSCSEADFQDLLSEFDPDQIESLVEFLNSPEARQMWLDSRPTANLETGAGRLEQGGYLYPDGQGGFEFYRAVANPGPGEAGITFQSECNIQMSYPIFPPPDGTIVVHTHPHNPGDTIYCGGGSPFPYPGGPSPNDDRPALGSLTPGIEFGIVIDGEDVYIYAEMEQDDPADPIDRCGY